MRELRMLVAAQLAGTTDPAVERAVLGTTDAEEITTAFVTWVRTHLGEPVRAWLWAVSVGVVAGFDLADGRRVVVKAHGPDRSDARLRQIVRLQGVAHERGLPVARPIIGPIALGAGFATAEDALLIGRHPDLRDSSHRAAFARGWIELTRRLDGVDDLLPDRNRHEPRVISGLYPEPHSPVFDFEATTRGAEWIDDLARGALAIMDGHRSPARVVHTDWRGDNVRVRDDGAQVVAIFDWDAVRLDVEARALGQVAAMHSVDWSTPDGPVFAAADECLRFAADVEAARALRYTADEWRVIRASILYGWCYTARCEHARAAVGHDHPMFKMRERLRSDAHLLRET